MGQMAVMDHTGDTKQVWDKDDANSVEIARAAFDTAKAKGYLAYKVDSKGDKGTQIKGI